MRLEYFFKILRSILGRKKFCHTRESFTMCPNWNSWSTTGTAFRFTFMKKRKIFPNLLLKHSYVSSNVCIMHSNLSIRFFIKPNGYRYNVLQPIRNLEYAILKLVWNMIKDIRNWNQIKNIAYNVLTLDIRYVNVFYIIC